MLILAVDTATAAVGAAVVTESERLGEAVTIGAVRHGEMLAPMVSLALQRAALAPSDLDAIAVGTGPGPFTGLRVGLVHARVMGLALELPVYGVCTLDVLAKQVRHAHPQVLSEGFLVATDARRREVYWARYDCDGVRLDGPRVGPAADIPQAHDIPAFGAGAVLYAAELGPTSPPEYPDPAVLGQIVAELRAAGLPPDPVEPLYLRRPDATPNPHAKRVLA